MQSRSLPRVRIFWPAWSREELVARLREGVRALAASLPVRRAILIGSWASGRQTVASDVDLLVVYAGPPRPDAYALCRTVITVPRLEPHVFSEEEYEPLRSTLETMAAGGVEVSPR